jgi:hypothetical protein
MYAELLIANYDTNEQARQFLQLTLWDALNDHSQGPQQILEDREVIENG